MLATLLAFAPIWGYVLASFYGVADSSKIFAAGAFCFVAGIVWLFYNVED
jgi:hypothetical protein